MKFTDIFWITLSDHFGEVLGLQNREEMWENQSLNFFFSYFPQHTSYNLAVPAKNIQRKRNFHSPLPKYLVD